MCDRSKDCLSSLHSLPEWPSATLESTLRALFWSALHLLLPQTKFGWHYSPVMSVHLDTVLDQSTLACLKRFVARRGLPKRFISDNGKTFKAASKYLDTMFKDGLVHDHLTGLGVSWQFNVERAPWWGGAFERMVRSTKHCLKKSIGRAHFSRDELTFLEMSSQQSWPKLKLLSLLILCFR